MWDGLFLFQTFIKLYLFLKPTGSPGSNEGSIEERIDNGTEMYDENASKRKTIKKRAKSARRAKKTSPQEVFFSNKSISNLSRALGPNDWIKLAYALGFLPQVM